jgi:hypothetical protein
LALTLAVPATAQPTRFNANLGSYSEVPSVYSDATGSFNATYDPATQTVNWSLSYSDFVTTVTQSHIHFGQAGVNGGVSVFLCSNLGNGPAGTQACPQGSATLTGSITAGSVIGPNSQGITAGQLDKVIEIMRDGVSYANIHSNAYPGGEIRGQIKTNFGKNDIQ